MEKIDDEMMESLSVLSKLYLTEKEKVKMKEELWKILDYVEKLNELDTEKTKPGVHVFENSNVFREDVVENGDMCEEMLANAPAKKDGQYEVPKTIG